MQIPPDVRDLGLLHPTIEVTFGVPAEYFTGKANRRFDTDNAWTSLQDIMVDMGILLDDGVATNNGLKITHPSVVDEGWKTHVVITEALPCGV